MWRHLILVLLAQLFVNSAGNCDNNEFAYVRQLYNSTKIPGLQDIETPRGEYLAAIYKKTFAYNSINERLPVILQRIVNWITQDRDEKAEKFGGDSYEEFTQFIGIVSELRSDVIANKPFTPLPLAHNDFDLDIPIWNDELTAREEPAGGALTFFNSPFLLSECYMYRRMNQALARTKTLKTYDPFERQKQDGFTRALKSLTLLANHTLDLLNRAGNLSKSKQKNELIKLLKLDLWGNRFDLSHSGGAEIDSEGDPVQLLDSFEDDLLIDDTSLVWDVLNKSNVTNEPTIVDIVLDNAGFELFTDLCLAAFLVSQGLAHKIRFYVKRMPWLISDVNRHDIIWTVEYMQNSADSDLKAFGEICARHLKNSDFTIEVESFWTEPFDFGHMKQKSPILYRKLSQATLVVIKGDLNYRKLIGDINWEYTTTLKTVLTQLDFRPTNLVSLRTLKCDICVGLPTGKAEELKAKDTDWLVSGKYGVINALPDSDSFSNDDQ